MVCRTASVSGVRKVPAPSVHQLLNTAVVSPAHLHCRAHERAVQAPRMHLVQHQPCSDVQCRNCPSLPDFSPSLRAVFSCTRSLPDHAPPPSPSQECLTSRRCRQNDKRRCREDGVLGDTLSTGHPTKIFAPHLCRSHANIHFLCYRNKGSHLEPGQAVQARKVLYVTSADVEAGSVPGTADSSFGQNPCVKDSIATSVRPCPQPTEVKLLPPAEGTGGRGQVSLPICS